MKINTMWTTALILTSVLFLLIQIMKKNTGSHKGSWTQFECGFNTMSPSHLPFSFQFFLISLLFLIFDVEIVLLLSYPLEPSTTKAKISLLGFILTLSLGLLYEWQGGKIAWSK